MLLNNAALLDAIETALIEANDAFKGWPELAAAALRAVADAGFVIVPREPTEAMLKAGEDAIPAGHGQAWLFAKDCYAAMIAAGGVG